jgi:hypothetical protein
MRVWGDEDSGLSDAVTKGAADEFAAVAVFVANCVIHGGKKGAGNPEGH